MARIALRIFLADTNQLVCRLLAEALERESDFHVAATAVSSGDLMPALRQCQPDAALIGAHLEEGPLSGFARLSEIRAEFPQMPWIMLLDRTDPELVVNAFRAGARGVYARSDSDVSMLSKCIRRVAEGQVWADSKQLHFLLEAFAKPDVPQDTVRNRSLSLLTAREETVVRLVAEGMGNREIAQHLSLSEHTVKNYLFRIFEKLGFSNRVELVLYAIARLNQPQATPARESKSSPILSDGDAAYSTARAWEPVS
jgi:two-component system, NarL family, nitrate/nitrite response regulator NarL